MHSRLEFVFVLLIGALLLAGCAPQPETNDRPTSQPTVLSQEALDQSWAGVLAVDPGAVRPDVQPIRFIEPTEAGAVMATCLTDAGFPTTDSTDAQGQSYESVVPQDQQGALALAKYVCSAQYPVDDSFYEPLSETELRALYDYFTEDLTACLEAHGVQVNEPPTWQSFVETQKSPDSWNPYGSYAPAGEAEMLALLEECPQMPSGFRQ